MICKRIGFTVTFGSFRMTQRNQTLSLTLLQSQNYSSELPRGSQFSQFMGLNRELEGLKKQQQKQEASDVRSSSTILVLAITVLGCGVFIAANDEYISFQTKMTKFKFQLGIFTVKKDRINLLNQAMDEIRIFQQKFPFQYKIALSQINYFVSQFRSNCNEDLLEITSECYSTILNRNFKAIEDIDFIQGIFKILELFILQKKEMKHMQLINALLTNGSIKNVYLAIIYYERMSTKILNEILKNQNLIEKIKNNLSNKINLDNQYYNQIFAEREASEYPQIFFKRQQEKKWAQYISARLVL